MPSPALNRVAAPEALDDEVEALVRASSRSRASQSRWARPCSTASSSRAAWWPRNQHDEVGKSSLNTLQPDSGGQGDALLFRVPKSA